MSQDTRCMKTGRIYLTICVQEWVKSFSSPSPKPNPSLTTLQITPCCLESSVQPLAFMQNTAEGFLTPLHSKKLISYSTPCRYLWAAFLLPMKIRWIFNCYVPVNSKTSPAWCLWTLRWYNFRCYTKNEEQMGWRETTFLLNARYGRFFILQNG